MTRKALMTRACAMALAASLAAGSMASMAYTVSQTPAQTVTAQDSLCALFINNSYNSVKPYYEGSTLMLPLRIITDTANWNYNYDNGVVTFGPKGKSQYRLNVGMNSYPMKNGCESLDYAPAVVDNHTYVPWQFIERLGFKVTNHPDGRIDVSVKRSSNPDKDNSDKNEGSLPVYVNGKKVGNGFYKGNTLMIPLRAVVSRLGYSYAYSNNGRWSRFSAKGIDTYINWDKNSYPIDNRYKKLERKPVLKDGSLYVPVSYATKALKCKASISTSGKIKLSR